MIELLKSNYYEVLNAILKNTAITLDDKLDLTRNYISDLYYSKRLTEHEKRKLQKHVHYYIWGVIENGE